MPGVSPEGKMGWAAAHDTAEPLYLVCQTILASRILLSVTTRYRIPVFR